MSSIEFMLDIYDLFIRQFFDYLTFKSLGKFSLVLKTLFAQVRVFLRQTCQITLFMAVAREFPTDNRFVFPNYFCYLFLGLFGLE
ncbi:hypothetical protein EZS27_025678 [termite gut metagenome]|uniref:Uncharacterized protein n=1 Tax=termite gut metagenome TaxID=433724 RepID=A0A5J4QVD4_9ZZZZ